MSDTAPAQAAPGWTARSVARLAGLFYVVIIVCGMASELAVRVPNIVPGDPAATAANLVEKAGLFRLSVAADIVMALSDVALAVLLFWLLRPAGGILALAAMAFRLVQAAIIGAGLLFQQAALLAANSAPGFDPAGRKALALLFLDLHAHGYDLGLVFFGVACLCLGRLIVLSGYLPRWLGYLVAAAGLVYLAGSFTRFLAPEFLGAVQFAYAIPLVAETAFALWLLLRGVDEAQWHARRRGPSPA